MKQFVVVFDDFNGGTEVFGDFETFEEASKWMKDDMQELINNANGNVEFSENEKSCEADGIGSWVVCELNKI